MQMIDVVELSPLSLEMFVEGGCLYVQAKRSLYLNQFTNLIYPNEVRITYSNTYSKTNMKKACYDVTIIVPPERREKHGVFLQRNKTKGTVGDEIDDIRISMEGLIIYNGLESKVDCNTMGVPSVRNLNVSYIVGSEDFMFRTRRRRKALYHKSLCSGASNGSHKLKRKLMFS